MRPAAALQQLPASRIVAAIAGAAARWTDADFPPRVRATRAIEERLRYSEPVVDYALDRLFGPVTVPAMRAVIENELGTIDALDGFAPRPHRPDAYARGAGSVTIVSSDTTIGVALWPALFALCAKNEVVVKDRSDDLLAAFAQTLAEEDEAFGAAFAAERWDGHDIPLALRRLAQADVVVAFGRNASLQGIRERCRPGARFFGLGHRTSVAYLEPAGGAAALEAARGLARDALLYDGDGCLSVHCAFIEAPPGERARWRALVTQAFDETSVEFPALSPREANAAAAFRAAQGDAPAAAAYSLAFDPPADALPPLEARSLAVRFVDGVAEAQEYLALHRLPLEAFALADPWNAQPAALKLALASGAARIGRIGDLQAPRLESNHGGDGRITPFIDWVVRG
jgi:hypothetical protein